MLARTAVTGKDGGMPDPMPPDSETELLHEATQRLVRAVDSLDDEAWAEPSGLPGWTRAHVIAHLTLNAEGLAGSLAGLVADEPTPMYASQEARDRDVEELAKLDPGELRTRLLGATTTFTEALGAVPDDAWTTSIERVPGGRRFRAGSVLGMRLREVEIHHADLAVGYSPADWDPAFGVRLIEAMGRRDVSARPFSVRATDGDRTWAFGEGGPTVSGTAADLAWWLTGRGNGEGLTSDDGDLPVIGAW